MSDISSPVIVKVYYWSPRRALTLVLFLLLVGIATLSCAAVKAETQNCKSALWHFVIYNVRPNLYAKNCGCPDSLDFRFSCNSQYLPLL